MPDRDQRSFDEPTLAHLSGFLAGYAAPAVLCAPRLGKALHERGVNVTILDTDERFADVRGYRRFDVAMPEWLGVGFDMIFCDPIPDRSLPQLFQAILMLARHEFGQPLLLTHPHRRGTATASCFAPFELRPTGYYPTYAGMERSEGNRAEVLGNLSEAEHRRLRSPPDRHSAATAVTAG